MIHNSGISGDFCWRQFQVKFPIEMSPIPTLSVSVVLLLLRAKTQNVVRIGSLIQEKNSYTVTVTLHDHCFD